MSRVETLNYNDFYWNDDGIFLSYLIDDNEIKLQVLIDIIDTFPKNERKEIYPYIFIAGMGQLSTLIKKYMPHKTVISCKKISNDDLRLWKKWYEKGLAEFFYKNKLKHEINLVNTPNKNSKEKDSHRSNIKLKEEAILPNGGGKDSCVSCEILKENNIKFTWATLGATSYRKKVMKASNIPNHINISVRRHGSIPNHYKTFRGHIPYTLYTSSFMVLLSGLIKNKYIVYSNEKSSNYPNLEHCETKDNCVMINHQYTKSFEFEKDFHLLLKRTVHPDIEYFSMLKPLYEIQISKIFSQLEQYHPAFVSCNKGRWCGKCSKCAFIYLSLYPYLDNDKLKKFIGNDMLDNKDMLGKYMELTGHKKHKPFECVGTIEENTIALKKCIEKSNKPYVNNYFDKNITLKDYDEDEYLNNYDKNNLIPGHLKETVKNTIFKYLNNHSNDNKHVLEYYENFVDYKDNYNLYIILLILLIIIIYLNKRSLVNLIKILKY